MKTLILTIACIFGLLVNIASSGNYSDLAAIDNKLYKAYISNNASLWLEGMNELKSSYSKSKNQNILFEIAKSQYGYIGLMIDKQEFEKAKAELTDAEKNISTLLKINPNWPDANALLAGIYGFKIILYPNLVIINGPKGKNYMEKASSLKNITPSVIIEMGNYAYHTPTILGGNINDAILYYKQAIKIIETKKLDKNNWQYLNTMIWLAISYDKIGNVDSAEEILKSLLIKEPNFTYLKNEIYPKFLSKELLDKKYYSME